MPLDPNIAMNFRLPQAETPFQTMGGMLTLRSEMMKQEEAQRQIQARQAFEREVQALPEEQRTTENLVKISAKYLQSPDKTFDLGQKSLDRRTQMESARAMRQAQLDETFRMNNARIADMAKGQISQERRDQLAAAALAQKQWYDRVTAENQSTLTHDITGTRPSVGPPPDIMGLLLQIQGQSQQAPQAIPQSSPQPSAATPRPQVPTPSNFPRETPPERSAAATASREVLLREMEDEQRMLAAATDPKDKEIHERNIIALRRQLGGNQTVPDGRPQGMPDDVWAKIQSTGTPRARREAIQKWIEATTAPNKPPAGYRWTDDGKLERIEGGPADEKAGEKGKKEALRQEQALKRADTVISKVDEALKRTGFWTTGLIGDIRSTLPGRITGSSAYDLEKTIDTIKANIGFRELQEMREASPTGGALGQIAVRELEFLQAVVASLDKGQDTKVLRNNLNQVKTHFENWKAAVRKANDEAPKRSSKDAPPFRFLGFENK